MKKALPENWELVKLEDYLDIKGGSQPPKSEFKYKPDDGYIRLLQIRDFGNKPVPTYVKKDDVTKFCEKEDILIARYGASLGRIVTGMEGAYNVALAKVIVENDEFSKRYLFYLLQTQIFQTPLTMISRSAQNGFAKHEISKIELPKPPLPTQHRIVEKIEELFSELDNGVENLKRAQLQLKTYRQAVLKDAFEGELTKEWRALRQAQDAEDLPTPEELLQQIKAERKAHRERELAEWEKEVNQWERDGEPGRKPRKPRKVKEVEPISENRLNELTELPNKWLWVKLGQVIDQPKYGTSEKCDYDFDGYGVLRIPNIGKGIIDSEDMKYAPLEEDEASKYALQEGDILTIRSNGSIDLVGKCALIREPDTKFLHAGYLIRLRPYKGVAVSRYMLNVLSSVSLRNQIESKAKSTSGVNNINSGELQDLIIPICGVKEQRKIVNEIESRLSVVDQLEQTIKENLQKAKALRQSILKKAFGGELVNE